MMPAPLTRVWTFSRSGKMVISAMVESLADARTYAARWNRDEKRADMRISVISTSPVPSQGWVTTVAA